MLFVKDLGPVVQMIAKQKLLGWFPGQKSQFSMTSDNCHCGPGTLDPVIPAPSQNFLDHVHGHPSLAEKSSERRDLEDGDEKGKTCLGGKIDTYDSTIATESGCERKTEHVSTWGEVQDRSNTTIPSVFFSDTIHNSQSTDSFVHIPYQLEISIPHFQGSKTQATSQ